MIVTFEVPDDLYHIRLSVIRLKKGGLQCHATAQDSALHMRGGDFTEDPQSAVDSALKHLGEAQVVRPAATPRFVLNLSGLTRKVNGPDQS